MTGALDERADGAPNHGACAQDGHRGCLPGLDPLAVAGDGVGFVGVDGVGLVCEVELGSQCRVLYYLHRLTIVKAPSG